MGWLEELSEPPNPWILDVSIPLWDDWKTERANLITTCFGVSIPLWDDWKVEKTWRKKCRNSVSIPLWDDWKALVKCSLIRLISCFNSTMGWLEEQGDAAPLVVAAPFQFHYGMIGSTMPKQHYNTALVFQFHYGMIGSHPIPYIYRLLICFNSTMGWLEDW